MVGSGQGRSSVIQDHREDRGWDQAETAIGHLDACGGTGGETEPHKPKRLRGWLSGSGALLCSIMVQTSTCGAISQSEAMDAVAPALRQGGVHEAFGAVARGFRRQTRGKGGRQPLPQENVSETGLIEKLLRELVVAADQARPVAFVAVSL